MAPAKSIAAERLLPELIFGESASIVNAARTRSQEWLRHGTASPFGQYEK
jgi:hypothetical protein